MYGIFTYIWLIFMVNVGKYTIHGWYEKSFFVEVAKNINQTDVTLLAIFLEELLEVGWKMIKCFTSKTTMMVNSWVNVTQVHFSGSENCSEHIKKLDGSGWEVGKPQKHIF